MVRGFILSVLLFSAVLTVLAVPLVKTEEKRDGHGNEKRDQTVKGEKLYVVQNGTVRVLGKTSIL